MPQAASEPPFSKVAIIGVGLIGGSLGLALKQRGLGQRVIGVTRRAETLAAALRRGAIDHGTHDPAAAVRDADLVVLCAPVNTIIAHLDAIRPVLPARCLVTDVGSTKVEICRAAAARLPASVTFLGGHPMAGSEASGVAAARADLFERALWLLTPLAGTPREPLERLSALVSALGSRPLVMSPELHDRLTAAVSHLPHLLAVALVELVNRVSKEHPEALDIAAGGFRGMTRIALGEPELWRDIVLTNRELILVQLADLRQLLDRLAQLVQAGDGKELERLLREAAESRSKLEPKR